MIETFLALFIAHSVADFLAQPAWIANHKNRLWPLTAHIAIIMVFSHLAVGHVLSVPILILGAVHMAMDAVKAHYLPQRLWAFLLDQLVHIATVAAIAIIVPDLWATGAWAGRIPADDMDLLLHGAAIGCGLIYCLRAGEFAVGLLMKPYARALRGGGLPNGGRLIGWLERGLIFLVVGIGQPLGIGFLIAAKSILRFGTAARDQRASEYVIIGTLASFGWAIACATLTFWSITTFLPPLEIGSAGP